MKNARCCSRAPFTRDSRSKKIYCKQHFSELIETRVRKTINRYKMLEKSDHVALGYSGGKDSTVLLHILVGLRKRFSNFKLTAITIDEGIKGYRDDCLPLTKKVTRDYNIDHVIVSFKELYGSTLDNFVLSNKAKNNSTSACAMCGILRRRAINYGTRLVNATKIATAHNLDDEAQTIIMNMLRGDTRKFTRLLRTPIKKYEEFIPRIRPFVRITEPEIVLYAKANELEYHSYPCPYAYSAMRNDIRDFLSEMEEKRPSTLTNIVNLHDSLLGMIPSHNKKEVETHFCEKCGEISNSKICPVCKLIDGLDKKE
ncbi:MAG: TIGR00269 family protein [Candidatus Hodarchaeales archaeon]